MAVIQVTPETLRGKANEVRGHKSTHDDTMAKLKSLIHGLNAEWKGKAQDAFVAKFDSMQSSFTQFSQMLEDYAKLMDTAARELEIKDQELAQTFR